MNAQEKSDALIAWWIETIYAGNPTAKWRQNLQCGAHLLPLAELFATAEMLKKYQARYHGAEHAQKDWERGEAILNDLRAKLPKEVEL